MMQLIKSKNTSCVLSITGSGMEPMILAKIGSACARVVFEQILEEIQTETAENRYQKMLVEEPELVQRIPLKHLASYFGIAPQSLSRIRKKLATAERI
jgi:hypothetical protein